MAQGLAKPTPPGDNASPGEIPGFELLEPVGEGGMGKVFLARQTSLDREVAIKFLRRELLTEEWFLERLEREARTVARLRHPNLVTVHDFIRLKDGTAAVVMEWIRGGSLRDRMNRSPEGLPLEEVRVIASQVASALAAAHADGIVHRDVKPENILIDAGGHARVTDFGMALSMVPGAKRLTQVGATAGTPGYLAPEQYTGAATDQRSDIFSLGVLTYEMLTGRLPLGSFDPPGRFRPELPRRFEDLILRSLRPDPAERPGAAAAWVELLRHPFPAESVPSAIATASSGGRRNWYLVGAVVALGLVTVAAVQWVPIWKQRNSGGGTNSEAAALKHRSPSEEPAPSWVSMPWPADLAAATLSGRWSRDGDALLSEDGICIVGLARSMPAAYDVSVRLQRLGGSESVAIFFRHGSGVGSFELDGWSRNRSGVQSIDGRTTQQEDGFPFSLKRGSDHELTLEVRPEEVSVWVDGIRWKSYSLAGRTLSVVSPWKWQPDFSASALAIGSYDSPFRFDRWRWRDRTTR